MARAPTGPSKGKDSSRFVEAIESAADKQVTKDLDDLFAKIEEQAALLVKKRTVSELEKYREMITTFINTAVQRGLKINEVPSARFMENSKVFIVARQVEEKLLAMAEKIRAGGAQAIEIAAATSEIRGMLLDMKG